MDSTIVMINLFGAVALLLFGLAQVKDGVTRAFGARLRTGLATGTRSGGRSFLSGFVATVALQSSTATALMVASFVEANWRPDALDVMGLSALERALDEKVRDEDFVDRGPESFGYVVTSDGKRSEDLTLAIAPLLA